MPSFAIGAYSSDDDDVSTFDEYDLESSDDESGSSTHRESETYESHSEVYAAGYGDVDIQNVVIDPGSGIFKAGFAGEEYPPVCFPNIVGTPRVFNESDWRLMKEKIHQRETTGERDLDLKLGQEAIDNMLDLKLFYPIQRGQIHCPDEFEALMELVFINHLNVVPENCNVLVAEPPMHAHKSREKMGEILFELLAVHGMKTVNESVLSLYSSGRTTGLMVTSGDQVTHVTPVFDGYIIDHGIRRINIGGRDVTHYLERIMLERGYDFGSSTGHIIAGQIKESIGFVSNDFQGDIERRESEFEETYELPDGSEVTLGHERFRAPEILFNPLIVGKELDGIAQLAHSAFMVCPIDVRDALRKNVILGGGSTLFPGFSDRLSKDMQKVDTQYRSFKVYASETRQFSSWMGGSVLASLSTFDDQVITLEEYEEEGPRILHKAH